MLTDLDNDRLDDIMDAVLQRREDRGLYIPDRDEELIARILAKSKEIN